MSQSYPDDTFLARWLNGDLKETELEQSEAGEDLETLAKIVSKVDDLILPPYSEKDAWDKLQQKQSPIVRRLIPLWVYGAAAAVIILLIGFWFLKPNNIKEYQTNIAHQEVTLPDQSIAILNAKSSLSYNFDETNNRRLLNLEGEGYFTVQKGDPFIISTKQATIEVLGTQFNVWTRKDSLDVSCYEGSVEVKYGKESIILEKGQRTRLLPTGKFSQEAVDTVKLPDWLSNPRSSLTGVSLARIFTEIEELYDVKIEFKGQDNGSYRVGIPQDNLDLALHIVSKLKTPNLTYTQNGNTITIE